MRRNTFILGLFLMFAPASLSLAQQVETFDFWRPNRDMIKDGVQALLMCNGLFTSNRTLELVFEQELAYLLNPVGTASSGDYKIDWERKAVEVGVPGGTPVMRAAFRDGIGCIVLAPDQTLEDISLLPTIDWLQQDEDRSSIPWPNGDKTDDTTLDMGVDADLLAEAADWAFIRPTPEQKTLSLVVLHKGKIILERYAPGVTKDTRTRTWSTAKSIAATLIGMLVDDGKLDLDEPLEFDWRPVVSESETDPRNAITLRHLLNMSSGLYPVDNNNLEYATGSGLAYWAGASSVNGALSRALIREPGSRWDYENYDTILAVYAMKNALGSTEAYHQFPSRALLSKIGMYNTLVSTDRFGDFILSSQVYTNARDLARFGLLYLQEGVWEGKQLLSESWIDFVRTPAPSTQNRGNFYGGQWWLVPDGRDDIPHDAYSTAGNRGQYVVVVPSHEVVIVRRGLDYGRQGFSQWDLTREILRAIPSK